MADIFISYAKADRPLALKLAAMLESEGWKVWWDTSLTIGDDFRNEIMTELGHARAVIVIWTDASVQKLGELKLIASSFQSSFHI